MDRLLLPLIGTLALLMAGAGGMFTWDRHPAWGVHVPVLWWHVGFDLPPSLAGQRDAALVLAARGKADLAQCHGNVSVLKAAMARQNAVVDALGRESEARVAQSAHAASTARAVAESYRRSAADILASGMGGQDACSAADALILKEAGQ